MLKKTIKVFILFGAILFGLAGNIGCSPSDDNQNRVMATYIETYFQEDIAEGEYNIVDNRLDLVALLNSDLSEKYNDAFFKNHSLLVFAIAESSHGNKSEIESYAIRDKTLTVQVKTTQFGDDCLMGYWWFILELSKDEIDHFNRVKIVKNGEEIRSRINKILYSEAIQCYFEKYIKVKRPDASIEDVWLFKNLGQYNDSFVGVFLDRKI